MTWEVGQVVAVEQGIIPDGGYRRQIVEFVYRDGSCRTDDGLRWTKCGEGWGAVRFSNGSLQAITDVFLLRESQELKAEEDYRKAKQVRAKREEVRMALEQTTDHARMDRALAVLRGEQ